APKTDAWNIYTSLAPLSLRSGHLGMVRLVIQPIVSGKTGRKGRVVERKGRYPNCPNIHHSIWTAVP
ncbi:hypothetical protein AVEN_251271-1, partial [Araneus ventricosus]